LLFRFEDDETPHLVYEEDAPATCDIANISSKWNNYQNAYNYIITYR